MFKNLDIGIDLGTANILVYVKGKGIVLKEPSVVAIDKVRNKVLAVGDEAREMLGRSPGSIQAIRPLKEGVIANYTVTQKLLAYVIQKVAGRSMFFKPRVMTCVPIGITSVEKRAVMEATTQGGASKTYLIEEPLAAALGAGIDISVPRGNMVVDIGGGTTDIAVLSLGGIVVDASIRIGGDHFDECIIKYVKKEHNVSIGERTAEEIKMKVATVSKDGRNEDIVVRGRDLVTGLPTTFSVNSAECREALEDAIASLMATIRGVLEKCPPELAADIVDNGIYMTGGGALLDGLAEVIQNETGITTHIAENPLDCVALGTGKALENLDKLHPGTVYNSSNLV
ncbi:MAG: rod shape-determining protein MreB [Phascolarctobacterium sp.]|nr:rod shape-determining protein MreB [Phascolarctobacterium sp.]